MPTADRLTAQALEYARVAKRAIEALEDTPTEIAGLPRPPHSKGARYKVDQPPPLSEPESNSNQPEDEENASTLEDISKQSFR